MAHEKLTTLSDVGLKSLTAIKDQIDKESTGSAAKQLFPYEPRFVPRDKDLFDLFDTTPDLTGADVDISRFIRDGDELDVQVFWREFPNGGPAKKTRPNRRELCSVPFYRFRDFVKASRTTGRIWQKTYRKGWQPVDDRETDRIYPGQVYLLEKSCGGYNPVLGWTGDARDTDFDLPKTGEPTPETIETKETLQDEEEDAEDLSQINIWLNVLEHTRDVCEKLNDILPAASLPEHDEKILRLAARWHDRGKAHDMFQSKLKRDALAQGEVRNKLAGEPAAKAPDDAWLRTGPRRGFRHELASTLAILETLHRAKPDHPGFAWPDGLDKSGFGSRLTESELADRADDPLVRELVDLSPEDLDLLVYLVAAHHGKVRMSIRSSPDDESADKKQARGVCDGDTLAQCKIPTADLKSGLRAPEVRLSLDLMDLGLSPRYGASWRERMQLLLECLGPFRLAYLEGLLRAADCRASIDEDQPPASKTKKEVG
ncbi:MAG: hypothetical protein H0X25_03515 [Acidobacteriales bacterium]|nr:hypothetical protein [Terriglobales bacterium]